MRLLKTVADATFLDRYPHWCGACGRPLGGSWDTSFSALALSWLRWDRCNACHAVTAVCLARKDDGQEPHDARVTKVTVSG